MVIISSILSYQSCVLDKREKLRKKNENKIYCRHFSDEYLPTKLPLPNFVILKAVYDISHIQGFKCGGFAVQENNVSSLIQTPGEKSVFSDISQNYICIVIV